MNFKDFIKDESNEEALVTAQALAGIGGHRRPLLVVSTPGLGKTHLLRAIQKKVLSEVPGSHVLYIDSQTFRNWYASRVEWDLRFVKPNCAYLLLDDFSWVDGNAELQERVLGVLRSFAKKGAMIAVASSTPIHALALSEDLKTWLSSARVVTISSPTHRARCAFVRQILPQIDSQDEQLLKTIVDYSEDNFRALEGSVYRLMAISSLNGDCSLSRALEIESNLHAAPSSPRSSG